jgi:hypothetical protein
MFFFRAGFRLTRKYAFLKFDVELLTDAARADLDRWGLKKVQRSLQRDEL